MLNQNNHIKVNSYKSIYTTGINIKEQKPNLTHCFIIQVNNYKKR